MAALPAAHPQHRIASRMSDFMLVELVQYGDWKTKPSMLVYLGRFLQLGPVEEDWILCPGFSASIISDCNPLWTRSIAPSIDSASCCGISVPLTSNMSALARSQSRIYNLLDDSRPQKDETVFIAL